MKRELIISSAPAHWSQHCTASENKLHQLSPYIGKLKSSIARDLLESYTDVGDVVLDPFCGSGTIPLEAALLGRRSIASDSSPYAFVLAQAKLHPPRNAKEALVRLDETLARANARPQPDLRRTPHWVRRFFHRDTLKDAIRFADECKARSEYFLLACFLGILHHQRPGFLSFPSSHLVPYLRERKFPRAKYPELYEFRDLRPRMMRKIDRALSGDQSQVRRHGRSSVVKQVTIEGLALRQDVDAIVTSPPYMNALDYTRDNRLRMWFLDRETVNYTRETTDKVASFDAMVHALALRVVSRLKVGGRCVLVVGETVTRKRMRSHPAERILALFSDAVPELRLEKVWEDEIPDVRRARREGAATKKELVLVLRKASRSAGPRVSQPPPIFTR